MAASLCEMLVAMTPAELVSPGFRGVIVSGGLILFAPGGSPMPPLTLEATGQLVGFCTMAAHEFVELHSWMYCSSSSLTSGPPLALKCAMT